MKKIATYLLILTALTVMSATVSHAQKKSSPMLRHVVLFKFKDDAKPEDVKKVEDAFVALKGKISLIKDFEWGTNSSPEGLNQGLTHCFFASFASDKDRDAYLVHPEHKAFVAILGPYLDKATVVDYWTK